jgi:hypothetical protein
LAISSASLVRQSLGGGRGGAFLRARFYREEAGEEAMEKIDGH